jgi:hypothetical protein
MARASRVPGYAGRLTPARFLNGLGLRRRSYEQVLTESYWRDVRRAGGDPRLLDAYGTYSPQAGDVFFATEAIARRTLSAEYGDLLAMLQYLDRMDGQLPRPGRVAVRRTGLGVDWRLSRCRAAERDGRWGITEDYVWVRPGMPHLGRDSREDALGFINSYRFGDQPDDLAPDRLAVEAERFRDGDQLLLAEGGNPGRGVNGLRLMQKDGLLLLQVGSNGKPVRDTLHSLSGVAALLGEVQQYLDVWNVEGQVRRLKTHPRLKRFIASCQQRPLGEQ